MNTFTGYEPNGVGRFQPIGEGSGLPTSMLPQQSASADAALVALPHDDLSEQMNDISLGSLQDFIGEAKEEEAMVAAASLPSQSSTTPFIIVPSNPSNVAGGNSSQFVDRALNQFQGSQHMDRASSHLPGAWYVDQELVKQALNQQNRDFEDTARQYEAHAEDVCKMEVAQTTAVL